MIDLPIKNARKKNMADRGGLGTKAWWVLHPSNDAILAYCDTEEEADKFIDTMNSLAEKWNKPPTEDNTEWTPGLVPGHALVTIREDYTYCVYYPHIMPPSAWKETEVEATGEEEYRGVHAISCSNIRHAHLYNVWWYKGRFIAQPK